MSLCHRHTILHFFISDESLWLLLYRCWTDAGGDTTYTQLGGGVSCIDAALVARRCQVTNNAASKDGGGLWLSYQTVAMIEECDVSFNTGELCCCRFFLVFVVTRLPGYLSCSQVAPHVVRLPCMLAGFPACSQVTPHVCQVTPRVARLS